MRVKEQMNYDHDLLAAAVRSEAERLMKEQLMQVAEKLVDDIVPELTDALDFNVRNYHLPLHMKTVIECIVTDGRSK